MIAVSEPGVDAVQGRLPTVEPPGRLAVGDRSAAGAAVVVQLGPVTTAPLARRNRHAREYNITVTMV
ncbi:hypothetical protein Ate01nite_36060 [Actinoplanes teichomyceticus]|nr:hypothetical protein Ate01nite_36060 [Actinoplanes teichomyceticus]